MFYSKQKQKPQQQKSVCRLDKETDAVCVVFKAHTFRLDSRVSGVSQRCIHLQASIDKIEVAAQIARIMTNQHAGNCSRNLLIYRIHSAVCVSVFSCVPDEEVGQDTTVKSKNNAVWSTAWEMTVFLSERHTNRHTKEKSKIFLSSPQ